MTEARTLPDGTEIGPGADAEAVAKALDYSEHNLRRLLKRSGSDGWWRERMDPMFADARAALARMQAAHDGQQLALRYCLPRLKHEAYKTKVEATLRGEFMKRDDPPMRMVQSALEPRP